MKVYHIELKKDSEPNLHFYFGSKAAIYDWLTPADIGVSYSRLRAINLKEPYENSKCIISLGELHRVSTSRGKKPKYKNIEDW